MVRVVQRVVTILALVAAAVLVPVVAAPPAHAAYHHCVAHLKQQGYRIGPKVKDVCHRAAVTRETGPCRRGLVRIGVRAAHARAACHYAVR